MSGNDERLVENVGLEKLKEDVAIVMNVLQRAEMPLHRTYSLDFLASMAAIGGVQGSRRWMRTVAIVVKERIKEIIIEMKLDVILDRE